MDGSDHTHDPVQHMSPGPYTPGLPSSWAGCSTLGCMVWWWYEQKGQERYSTCKTQSYHPQVLQTTSPLVIKCCKIFL